MLNKEEILQKISTMSTDWIISTEFISEEDIKWIHTSLKLEIDLIYGEDFECYKIKLQ